MMALCELAVAFTAKYPKVRLELDFANRYVDLIEEGVDVALRAGQLHDSSLIAHKLASSPTVLVASPDYLARHGAPQTIDELGKHDCILLGRWPQAASWTLEGQRGQVSVPVRGRLALNNMAAARAAVLAGAGIAMLPALFCVDLIREGRLDSRL